jgi:hypothetical protein
MERGQNLTEREVYYRATEKIGEMEVGEVAWA